MKEQIKNLIEHIVPICSSWINIGENSLARFEDPIEGEEISAHYGATHAATAFIIWGKHVGDEDLYQKGLTLLNSILGRWDHNKTLPTFHFDFNNLALSIVEPFVDEKTSLLIREKVCQTNDSRHDTINWLPMRWIVNKKRNEWTSSNHFEKVIAKCKRTIANATNADGGIEDRLPHGKSFNLQYDLATVAILQYLRVQGEQIDLSKELGFLMNSVAPDGDINYQGRGSNQIFAWGLWVYLLASSGQTIELKQALDYLNIRLCKMLDKNSIMLNEWDGKEKYLWWDYHFTSVYTAHFLLWLVMAYIDADKAYIKPLYPTSNETGLHIYRSENCFVSWFEGRTEYLAEKGPSVVAIWTKSHGMICKGTFAPWQGTFGNLYIYEDVVIKNFCGLIRMSRNKDWSKIRYINKLLPYLRTQEACTLKPLFCPVTVRENYSELEIIWDCVDEELIFNLPAFSENCRIKLYADGIELPIFCNSSIKNQYKWVFLHQSRRFKAKQVIMVVKK